MKGERGVLEIPALLHISDQGDKCFSLTSSATSFRDMDANMEVNEEMYSYFMSNMLPTWTQIPSRVVSPMSTTL